MAFLFGLLENLFLIISLKLYGKFVYNLIKMRVYYEFKNRYLYWGQTNNYKPSCVEGP